MPLWWKFPNQGIAASVARWGLASAGVGTLAWCFTSPPPLHGAGDVASDGHRHAFDEKGNESSAELSRWMRSASQEGSSGSVLTAALEQVGPWARNQTQADNEKPAQVPSSSSSSSSR